MRRMFLFGFFNPRYEVFALSAFLFLLKTITNIMLLIILQNGAVENDYDDIFWCDGCPAGIDTAFINELIRDGDLEDYFERLK